MSKTIDEKVVSMKFDNSNFEKNVSKSMTTIDKLKEKLNFTGATKGLDEIEKASRKVNFDGLTSGLNNLTYKLDLANVFCYRLATTISDMAISAVKSIGNVATSLTYLNPSNITAGWSKFEEQTKSVQTILSSVSQKINKETGELYNTDDVYETINKLSWYADETSYNMEQMTSAIASFTSTGMDLKDAEEMIMGISNACALAGVDATHAEHAFLGLSKSVGQGYVTLSVWNNQLKTSGLSANEEFKQSLLDAGVAMGHLEQTADGLYNIIYDQSEYDDGPFGLGSLENTLTKGKWLTTDVLEAAFATYSEGINSVYAAYEEGGTTTSAILSELAQQFKDAGEALPKWLRSFQAAQEAVTMTQAIESAQTAVQSVWSNIYTVMFGDIDQQKKTWTQLANDLYSIFAEPAWSFADVITEAFGVIDEANPDVTGTTLLADALHYLCETIININTIVGDAWNNVFPPEDRAKALQKVIVKINSFTKSLAQNTKESKTFKSILTALFSTIKMVGSIISQVVNGAFSIFKNVLSGLSIDISGFSGNVGDAAEKLASWVSENKTIQKTLENVGNVVGKVVKKVREWIQQFMELPIVQKIIEGLSEAAGNFKDIIVDVFENGMDFDELKKQFSEIFDASNLSTSSPLMTFAKTLGATFGTVSKNISEFVQKIKNKFKELDDSSSETSKEVQDIINRLISGCETLVGFWVAYKIVTGLNSLAGALQTFVKPLTSVSTLIESLASAPKSISNYFNALTKNVKTNYIIKIAAALTVLSIAFFIMAKIDWQKLAISAGVLVLMGAALVFLSKALTKLSTEDQSKQLQAFSNMMLKFAASIAIIAIAFKVLENTRLETVIGFCSILIASMAVVALAAKILSNKAIIVSVEASAKTILAFAASILILVAACKKIDEINFQDPIKTIGILAGLVFILAGAIAIMNKVSIKNSGVIKIIAVVGSLYLLVKIAEKLSNVPTKTIHDTIINLIPILTTLGVLFKLGSLLGGQAKSVGVYLLALSAGLLLLTFAIKRLANIDAATIAKTGIVCVGLMAVMGLVGKLLTLINGKGFSSLRQSAGISMIILSLSAAMVLMVGMILILKNISGKDLLKAGLTLGGLMVAFGGMFALMNVTKALSAFKENTNAVTALTKMMILLAVITACIYILSTIPDTWKLLTIVGGITAILLSLSVMCIAVSKISKENLLPGLIMLTAVMVEVGALILIIYNFGGTAQDTFTICAALSLLFVSLSVSMLVLSVAGTLASAAMPGIYALIGAVALIGTLIVALQAILNAGWIGTDLSLVTELLTNLGAAIGGFVGGLIGGVGSSMMDKLGPSLQSFGGNLKSFLTDYGAGVKELPEEDNTKAFDTIANVVKTFTDPAVYSGIKKLGAMAQNGELESLKTFMTEYSKIVIDLSDTLSDGTFNAANVQAAADAGTMMANLYDSIPSEGGVASWFTGEKSLTKFGQQMEDYAQSLVNVCLVIATSTYFSTETVEAAKNAGDMMSELANAIPDQGTSLMSILTGKQDLGEFGNQIKTFVEGLTTGCKAIVDADKETNLEDAANRAVQIGEIFRAFSDVIPEMTSLKSLIIGGDQNLGNFGSQISVFARGIASMSTIITNSNVTSDAAEKATNIGKLFAALASSLPEDSGLLGDIIGGNQDLETFGNDIINFVDLIKRFNEKIKTIKTWPDTEKLNSLNTVAKKIINLASYVSNTPLGEGMSLSELGSEMAKFGEHMKTFSNSIANFDGTNVDAVIAAIKATYNAFVAEGTTADEGATTGANNTVTTYGSKLTTGISNLKDSIKTWFSSTISGAMNTNEEATSAATDAVSSYNTTLTSDISLESIATSATTLVTEGTNAMNASDKAQESGKNTVRGLLSGLQDAELWQSVRDAGTALANEFTNAYNSAQVIKSPSRRLMESGKYTVLGLVKGINNNLAKAKDSGTKVGEIITEAINASLALVDNVDENINPVITPVLDLSQVQSGANDINKMLNNNESLSLAAGITNQNSASSRYGNNITLNVDFSVNNAGRDLTESDVLKFSTQIADKINEQLGFLL